LNPGQIYYYRAWSFTADDGLHQYSDDCTGGVKLVYPEDPTVCVANYSLFLKKINLTWTKGTGANRTVVVMKHSGIPSNPSDGTIIYNGTGEYYIYSFNIGESYYFKSYSYTTWSGLSVFSQNGTLFSTSTQGGLVVNCYDENTENNLTFNIIISNKNGSETYTDTNCVNPLIINESVCPQGKDINIVVNSTGYHQRSYIIDIYSGIIYILNTYLIPKSPPGGGDCNLLSYYDSSVITDKNNDLIIVLTKLLDSMISVEIYNNTLYGSYGGWLFLSSSYYSFNTTHVVINCSVFDKNTSMVRVNYFYLYCPGDVESALYYLRVVETITTDYSSYDKAVEEAFFEIKRHSQNTGHYITIYTLYTDANGYVNVYLNPDIPYKIYISKNGYNSTVSDYIPPPPNQYGQTTEKWFRIVKTPTEPPVHPWETLWTNITWSIEPTVYYHTTGFIIYYNISSIDNKIEWFDAYLYVYNSTNFTWILLDGDNKTISGGGSISFVVPNVTGKYSLVARFKKVNYSVYTFGATDGCRFYFISLNPLEETVSGIPDMIYLVIMIFLMIAAVAFLVRFGAGVYSGIGGIGVMAFMLAIKSDLTIGSPAVSAWWMLLATVIIYIIVLFLSRGKT